jgi:adenylyl-sulfate kinase
MKICWFTGLSGAGKSTIAGIAKRRMEDAGKRVLLLDGDEIRAKFNTRLAFTRDDIIENNRFIASLCAEKLDHYDHILVAVITPFECIRKELRHKLGDNYSEIYVKVSLEEAARRDVKGLYAKAFSGQIKNFIGVDENTPYEPPLVPDLILETERETAEDCVERLIAYLRSSSRKRKMF